MNREKYRLNNTAKLKTPSSIKRKLNERKEDNSFRSLLIPEGGIDFYSNDYLGIAQLESRSSQPHGSTGSRLISGNSDYVEDFENTASVFFKQSTALLFNSGYAANLGLLSSVPLRGDTILFDELCHASIRDGIRLSQASAFKFRHQDLDHLKARLETAKGQVYVVVESVYSMDGDQTDLNVISALCKSFGAFLIVDEAHSGGVYGNSGEGLLAHYSIDVFATIITFGKAFGSHGALVLGSADLRNYLINFSRPFIYTTALPLSSVERLNFVLKAVANADSQRQKLHENIRYFRNAAAAENIPVWDSHSPIQGVIIPSNTGVKEKAAALNKAGFLVKAILSPTVPEGKERIRICLHSYNSFEEIDALIKAL